MTCPKCGHEQPDVFSQCEKCRYIFPSNSLHPSTPLKGVRISFPSAGSKPSIATFVGALSLVFVLLACLWWLFNPEGLPLVEGSYINQQHQFALAVPPDWIMLNSENYREVFDQLGNRLPKTLQKGLSDRRIEVGFVRPPKDEEFSPNMNVVVMEADVPDLDEEQKEEATKVLSEMFSRLVDSYKLESSELTTVDDLTSLHFVSKASLKLKTAEAQRSVREVGPGWRTYKTESPAEWTTYDLTMTQTLVPGKKRAYIITCTAEASQYSLYRRIFEKSIDSFRVLQRPNRFGPILMGGLQGGLIGAILPLLYYIITALVGFIRH